MNAAIFDTEMLSVTAFILIIAAAGLITTGIIIAIRKNKAIWHIMTVFGGVALAGFMAIYATMIYSTMEDYIKFAVEDLNNGYTAEENYEEYPAPQSSTSGVYIVGDFYPVVFTTDYSTNNIFILDASTKENIDVLLCGDYSNGNIPKDNTFSYIHVEDHNNDAYNDIIISMDNGDSVVFLYDYYSGYFFNEADLNSYSMFDEEFFGF